MRQLPLFQPSTFSVTELTRKIREILEGSTGLQEVWVTGEVSNCARPSSGHMYFTLKDSGASLKCVMWRSTVQRVGYFPRDGDAVEAFGSISVFEPGGTYQLYVDALRPTGEGLLYQEFLHLKARLEAEGLFDPALKRPVPEWPHVIGIVTSPSGAALHDMLTCLRRRYPLVKVVLAPTAVQGAEAPSQIVAALESLNRFTAPDVILLARGGGSIEDLWAFNDERVARAIRLSQAPVISGVGHETDFTIADFAADLRAPTPTAAAELAVPNSEDLYSSLFGLADRMLNSMRACLAEPRWQLRELQNLLARYSPHARLRSHRQSLDELAHRLSTSIDRTLQVDRIRLESAQNHLAALNPGSILSRGYAIVTRKDGKIIDSIRHAKKGSQIQIRVSDGSFDAQINQGEENSDGVR